MRFIFASVALLATLVFGSSAMSQELPRGHVNFLVVSDLGAFGGGDQPEVAASLGRVAESFAPTAILNMGDTFHFWGVESVDDPGWMSNFENIYTAPYLHSLWYCALGNHDYQGNTQALVDYTAKSRRWNMPARYYSKTFSRRGTTVEVIVLDTTPFLQRAQTQPEIYPDACLQDTAAQTAWLEKTLAASTADWVIVAAHHPVYSSRPDTSHQRADIQAHIAPVLAKRRPDAYICGDVHCFEHFAIPDDPTDYFTCSAGSLAYPVDSPDARTHFTSGSSGFMTLSADAERLSIAMLDKEGRVLYTYTKTKH